MLATQYILQNIIMNFMHQKIRGPLQTSLYKSINIKLTFYIGLKRAIVQTKFKKIGFLPHMKNAQNGAKITTKDWYICHIDKAK